MQANIDASPFGETNYSVFAVWSTPLQVAVDGESHYDGTDAPGTPSSHSIWTSIQGQQYSGNAYVGACGNMTLLTDTVQPNGRFADSQVGCNHVDSWTQNPAHP